MAVTDTTGKLGFQSRSVQDKLKVLTETLYITGRPDLRGVAVIRLFDSLLVRTFGALFSLGPKALSDEEEYLRLTGNFKRIGKIALMLRRLGPVTRLVLRSAMGLSVQTLGRQHLFGLDTDSSDVLATARKYFTAVDYFNFNIEIDAVEPERVTFRFLECPIGYVSGDDMRICMGTNKWDRQCARMMGARMVIEELIPEGAPACLAHIMPEDTKVPDPLRRYPRYSM